jgi:glyoxylase-like metal-dependent hydrolase (beta-lactamase superfamily II)
VCICICIYIFIYVYSPSLAHMCLHTSILHTHTQVSLEDGARVTLGWGTDAKASRELVFHHTRGHANHHFVVHDIPSNSVFSGDAFGVSYIHLLKALAFDEKVYMEQPLLFPSSSPIDFDSAEAKKSIDVILNTGCDRVYVSHTDSIESRSQVELGAKQMHFHLDRYEEIVCEIEAMCENPEPVDPWELQEAVQTMLHQHLARVMVRKGLSAASNSDVWPVLQGDITLNAQGLIIAAKRRLKKRLQAKL